MKNNPPAIPQEREALEQMSQSALIDLLLKQQEVIEGLVREIERLKGLLSKDSQTSSKPPSSDLIKRSEKPAAATEEEANKRKPGGQPGHKGKTRKGFGRIDRYEMIEPQVCPECGGHHFEASGKAIREYVVAEWVERPIEVVAYQQVKRVCCGCGSVVAGELPATVIPGQDLSTKLQGMLGWLGHYAHLSYEKQQEWLREFGGIEVGVGTLEATTCRLAEAVTPQVKELQGWVKQQAHVQVDESPWLVKGVKEWMWVLAGKEFSLFHAGDTRSRAELEHLLGKSFAGVLSSDDFSVYNGYPTGAQQKCLAHLLRHFRQLTKLKLPHQAELGNAFEALIGEAFRHHRQWRQTQDEEAYAKWAAAFKPKVMEAIETWRSKAGYAAGLLLRSLREKFDQWWYFLDHPEVPPDNNQAERSLRLAVTKRKVCGGSRSMKGFEHSAKLLSVIQSCRAQGRSVVDFFTDALSLFVRERSEELSLIPKLL